jgi:hypothetical protein
MWRRMALLGTDVSKERIASIIRMKRINDLETTLAVTSNFSYSETSVLTIATRRHISENGILHSYRRENLKSYIVLIRVILLHLWTFCTFVSKWLTNGIRGKGMHASGLQCPLLPKRALAGSTGSACSYQVLYASLLVLPGTQTAEVDRF